ncbi:MAG: hypothetical protein ABSG81_14760 [Acidimicrobiales bacterium]
MSTDPCERFRGIIAIEVVGHISGSERTALAAHTEGCTSCRDERRELLRLPDALGAADPDRFDDQELPFALRTAVLDRLAAEGRRQRRHTVRSRLLVGSAAAAAVAVIVAVTALVWPAGTTVKTVAMRGEPGVHAVVRLTAEPWGTAMELRESGQPPGQLLSVSTEAASGVWWQTGTYRTAGASVRVTMACALKLSEITRVWVRDSAGTILLRGSLHSYDGGPAA